MATSVKLGNPAGIAVDADGKLYVSDCWFRDQPTIYTIDSAGMFEHFAGSGYSFGGDGGPALEAQFWCVPALAFDSAGNLFIADSTNHRVREVSTGGTISTIAGDGFSGFSGDNGPALSAHLSTLAGIAVDAPGNVYVVDVGNQRVRKISN